MVERCRLARAERRCEGAGGEVDGGVVCGARRGIDAGELSRLRLATASLYWGAAPAPALPPTFGERSAPRLGPVRTTVVLVPEFPERAVFRCVRRVHAGYAAA